ncbi:MAG: hypothetical protein IPJ69_02040 [Deltaproteobacteria bacterium]|nr:MAG: hypothetical protein IPJ69_02040 [Deltaproteobacteria bacterium]
MNTVQNVIPFHNPLDEYKAICDELKNIEAHKEALRSQIMNLMDESKSEWSSFLLFNC